VEPPVADDGDHKRSWFVYVVKVAEGVDRDAVVQSLAAQGIEAGLYVPAVHLQPYMRERYEFGEGMCPVAEDACLRTFALPFFPHLDAADQELVIEALRDALAT
jgi:perosamine synthetase